MPTRGKRARTESAEKSEDQQSINKAKKLKLLASHSLASPFPDYTRPTRSETFQVHDLLSRNHPSITTKRKAPSVANNSAKTCGSVPNVLESLIGTILSQNTAGRNSTAAKRSLDETFGKNNFEAIATAPRAEVVEAIRRGGLANKKAGVIQTVLKEVKDRYGEYSLQHLAGIMEQNTEVSETKDKSRSSISNEEAMSELISFEGVGPKTASCVLLFCLGRSSFPVDTHVFRLARLLGWVPLKADRVTAQAHLDLTIPDELKYGLHVLMVSHGKR
ncbi:hypothetical protein QCA50_011374 [Cerrena zonata]|uniref:HhH-GPD domain-containing protein n=1 Tax=Cerrena zonata TaxID=2478898 RepID=A0AAW0G5D7_9APHY